MDNELSAKIISANREMHNRDNEKYSQINPYMKNAFAQREFWNDLEFICSLLPDRENALVLDCAAGTGNLTLKFLHYGCKVVAVDVSEGMLSVLKRKTTQFAERIQVICCDLDSYFNNTNEQFDIVSFCSALHHFPNYLNCIENSCRRLKKGGVLYIVFEPAITSKEYSNKILDFLDKSDEFLYTFISKKKYYPSYVFGVLRRKLGKDRNAVAEYDVEEVRLAEYHVFQGGGLDDREIIRRLKGMSMNIIRYELYCTQRLKLIYDIARWLGRRNTLRIIAQKV